MGVSEPSGLTPYMLRKRIGPISQQSYAEIYEWLAPEVLLNDPPASWAADWEMADPDSFTPAPWHQSARG